MIVRGGRVRIAMLVSLAVGAGCREYHEPVPFDACHPYALECPTCSYVDEAADDVGLLRLWRCEDPEVGVVNAAMRVNLTIDAVDMLFYSVETGLRISAVQRFGSPSDVCGRELDEAWYGMVLSCEDRCEHDADLDEADPEMPACGGIQ